MYALQAFGLLLITYSLADIKDKRIPHQFTAPSIFMAILYQLANYTSTGNPIPLIIAMVAGGGVFLAADFITRHGWWGGADTVILTATAFMLGGSLLSIGKFLVVFPLAYLGMGYFWKLLSPERFIPMVPIIAFAFFLCL